MHLQRVLFVVASLIGLSPVGSAAQLPDSPLNRQRPHPRPSTSRISGKPVQSSAPPYSPAVTDFKLLTPTTGWISTRDKLFWTADGGEQWKDIAPPLTEKSIPSTPELHEIASVFFLDTKQGWVLIAHNYSAGWQFDLATTSDGGETWSKSHVGIPEMTADLAGHGRIAFADRSHGLMNISLTTGASFRGAVQLKTADGGKTWTFLRNGPGRAGEILLLNDQDAWLTGGPDDTELWTTHDAGNTWQQILLPAPVDIGSANFPTYDIPVFKDRLSGFVPVTYSGGEGVKSAAVLFATQDGGRTWKTDRVLANLEPRCGGQKMVSGLADSTWITPIVAPGRPPALKKLLSNDRVLDDTANISNGATKVSFATPQTGWVAGSSGLFSTTDGGATWTTLTLPGSHGVSVPNASPNESEPISGNPSDTTAVQPFCVCCRYGFAICDH
jgi:photosystem II stability/assembly factor-like uncharacterized protein